MNKRKKKNRPLLLLLLLFIVIVGGAWLAYHFYSERTGPLTHTGEITPDDAFNYEGQPVIQTVSRWYRNENLDQEAINSRLPDHFRLLILDRDINANSAPNFVLIATDPVLPELDRSLSDFGFTHVFRNLVVYETRDRSLYPILTIGRESIQDEYGTGLIHQIPAENGYALVMEEYEHDALYEKPVQLIEIVMLDENGMGASDDIVIYWDPSEAAYKATNTFGAP